MSQKRKAAAQEKKIPQLGKQPPLYRFFLNPYKDARFTSCPQCEKKTRPRKLPLFIHIKPIQTMLLNKTCRYCPGCDLLIAHKDELDEILEVAYLSICQKLLGMITW